MMERDTIKQRGGKPYIFTNLKSGEGVDALVAWVSRKIDSLKADGERTHLESHEHHDEAHHHVHT